MKTTHPILNARGQAGITLVELMISLLLSLLLVAGMIQVFAGNRATYEFTQGLSRIQENARFSLDHIAFHARMAGYSGCLSDVAYYNNLDVAVPENFRDDIQNGIQGYNANNTREGDDFALTMNPAPSGNPGEWSPALPVELTGFVVPGSDVLVVRSIAANAQPLITPFSDATQLFVPSSHDFMDGEVLIVSDCQKASLFQLTQSGAAGLGDNLEHVAGAFAPGNDPAAWGPEQEYGLGAEVARLETHAFYVGRGANGRPSLFQLRLLPNATFDDEELVEGIETMQVRYGIDPDNDGAIDDWVTADAVADWTRVLSLDVTLLARSTDEYGSEEDTATYDVGGTEINPEDDRRLRQVFSSTIGVRNRLP